MSGYASRVDLDRMGSIVRASPRQADVMVVAGTITVKMAPRVKKLWEQMPEPKWCIAMGSCAISGDFYRNLYSVVPGIDTVLPVDVYVPGCPPNPEALMHGLLRLLDKVKLAREGGFRARDCDPTLLAATKPSIDRLLDPARSGELTVAQQQAALAITAPEVEAAHRREAEQDAGDHSPEFAPDEHDAAACEASPPAAREAAHTEAARAEASHVPEDFAALLASEFGIAVLPEDGPPILPAARHLELARRLRALGYRLFDFVVATHFPEGRGRGGAVAGGPEHVEVAFGLRTVGARTRIATWCVRLLPGEPVPSLVGLFAGADWQEREQFDLVGVHFAGHPDERRLLLPEDWSGHPLRRDFPADAPCAPWR
jgi:NADH-quinone oxidoreductase B subunit